ncbi:hypothetical protein PENTCL1PPCAC_24159, partial [Pristionchus entomophagus]
FSTVLLVSSMSQHSAVQIVEKVEGSYVLKEDVLRKILRQKSVENKKVAVLSVAGAFRKGKSFFLSNCVRYLQSKTNGSNWMASDASVTGFTWKQSIPSVTEGILMWPEPFVVKNANGEEVAILLMDTEGAFDHKSSFTQCATVFALSALLSSLLVYNVMQDIQEDTLNHLQFFAKYGSYALDEENNNSPFQSLMFLVRDWQNSDEYGMEAGRKLLDEKLKPAASCQDSMLALRKDIQRSFVDIKCSLLPGPGNKICRGSEGTILVNDMDAEFKAELGALIPYMVDNLICPKKIGGKEITGAEFIDFFKVYTELFASGKVPEPKSIYEATVDATHQMALNASYDHYNATMKMKFSQMSDRQFFEEPTLQCIHQEIMNAALQMFTNKRKMGSLPQYLNTLKDKIEVLFKDFLRENIHRITIERERQAKEEAERRIIEQEQMAKKKLVEVEIQKEEMRVKMEHATREREEADQRRSEAEKRHKEETELAEIRFLEDQKRSREEQTRRDREVNEQMERERRVRAEEIESVRKQMEQMRLENDRREAEHKREMEMERQRRQEAEREREREVERVRETQRSYQPQSFMPSPSYESFSPPYLNSSRAGTPSGRSPGRPRGSVMDRFNQGILPKERTRDYNRLQRDGYL